LARCFLPKRKTIFHIVAKKKGNFDNVWGIREDARAIDDEKCGAQDEQNIAKPHVYRD
jgi:hypothetical protein